MREHPVVGTQMLIEADADDDLLDIALHHHEKYDGTGYCRGLSKANIPLYARIVSVADVYDAMSNDRVYQRKSAPDKVFREITHLGDKHFDTEIMETFAKHINIYPTGTGIILNTGHRGIVLYQNKLYPESPIVRIFLPKEKNPKRLYFDLDLSVNTKWRIAETF